MKRGDNLFLSLRRAIQRIGTDYDAAVGKGPALTLPQYHLLSVIDQRGPQLTKDLIEKSGMDRSTVGELLIRLTEQKLIRRCRFSIGNRGPAPLQISFTVAGARAFEKANICLLEAEVSALKTGPSFDREKFNAVLAVITGAPK